MISIDDAPYTYDYDDYYKILPSIHSWALDSNRINDGVKVSDDFTYTSDNNKDWMETDTLKLWIKENRNKIGKI